MDTGSSKPWERPRVKLIMDIFSGHVAEIETFKQQVEVVKDNGEMEEDIHR